MASNDWRTSSFCGSNNCVEVKQDGDEILVRNSKRPDGSVVGFTPAEWTAFVEGVKADEFDLR